MRKTGLALLLAISLTACQSPPADLHIAVAANFAFAMEELVEAFEAETNLEVRLSTASSGSLTAQIKNGAPFDYFLSADTQYPDFIHAQGLAKEAPHALVQGKLMLWTKEASPNPNQEILQSAFAAVAIADPDLAPYGKAARDWLMFQGLWDSVQAKLIYGNSIAQVNQYIHSGTVEAAFTAASARHAEQLQSKGHWYPIRNANTIQHAAVLLSEKTPAIESWLSFLASPKANDIFQSYGYEPLNSLP